MSNCKLRIGRLNTKYFYTWKRIYCWIGLFSIFVIEPLSSIEFACLVKLLYIHTHPLTWWQVSLISFNTSKFLQPSQSGETGAWSIRTHLLCRLLSPSCPDWSISNYLPDYFPIWNIANFSYNICCHGSFLMMFIFYSHFTVMFTYS